MKLVMRKVNDKKGSFIVYACVFTVGMSILISALIGTARNMYVKGIVPSLGRLWGKSILGEYDLELYNRYGIMAFCGNDRIIMEKLKTLYSYSFDDKSYIDCEVEGVDLYGYSMADQNKFMEQIRLAGIEALSDSVLGDKVWTPVAGEDMSEIDGRTIESESIITSLPSYGRTDDSVLDNLVSLFKNIGSPKELIKEGTDSFLINKYIAAKFASRSYAADPDKSYLLYEREYIVGGKFSDEENAKAVRRRIIAIREAANLAFIERDKKMRMEAAAIGEIITLGYGGELGAQAVMATWAYLESLNDYELLVHGKKVPAIKNHQTWAVDSESIDIGWDWDRGYIDTACIEGDTYSDYLSLFTYMLGRDTKLLRMMDIIQINLKYYYRSDFLMSEHFSGLDFTLKINGNNYDFSDSYSWEYLS